MFIAPTIEEFKENFIQGLKKMLNPDELGAFILVLANSMQDKELHQALTQDIAKNFSALQRKSEITGPDDDIAVFSALLKTGIKQLSQWETYSQTPWELIYNPLRALRPARAAQQIIKDIQQPFDTNKFHFNKPFLRPEILWEGHWQGTEMRVLYNKFPFAPWHLIIVPEPEKQQPQFLTQAAHQQIMTLVAQQSQIFTGFGVGFNSLGAYASINQLHFQGFIKETPLPIEASQWTHNGGNKAYPVDCYRCQSADKAWQIITKLHQENQPYNLLYRNNTCYILPRKGQGQVDFPEWAQGTAWYEVCGVFTLSDKNKAQTLDASNIKKQLEKLRINHKH